MAANSLNFKKLICIGDSHASFFSGVDIIQDQYPASSNNTIPNLEGIRLGAVLAYSLHRNNTSEQGREKLMEIVSATGKENNAILFCFGEIDCRFHILKQAELRGISMEECVRDCVGKYFGVVKEIADMGFEVFVWNAIPTSRLNSNPEYPHYGSHLDRNRCTRYFNETLRELCIKNNIPFISIFDELVDKQLNTKEYFLFDGLHLGQAAMPLFIREIRRYFPHLQLSVKKKFDCYYTLAKSYLYYRKRKAFAGKVNQLNTAS